MNKHTNLWLLLAGDYHPPAANPQAHDPIIAVDGGIRHAAAIAREPDLWIGDFDSADSNLQQQYPHIPRLAFAAEKDQTDFELALAHINNNYKQGLIHIIGSSGNEADHSFANLIVLPQSALPCILWQQNAVIVAAHGAVSVQCCAEKESKISIFSLTPLRGLHYRGLRWQAPKTPLQPFTAHAARNETTTETAQISWQSGTGILFLPHNVRELRVEKR